MANFIELCRKGANWPALHRDVPQFNKGGRWSMTQEELAAFVGQVRSRSDDLIAELRSKDELIAKLSDQKAAAIKEVAEMGIKLAHGESAERVKKRAESMGLEADQVVKLSQAATAS